MKAQLSLSSKTLLALCLVAVIISTNWVAQNARRVEHLTLATGDLEGESYILGQAIAQVVKLNAPKLDISVISTSGSDENLEQIEQSLADLAIAQADMPGGAFARTIAVLFDDVFQLIVQQGSSITQFTDLVGRTLNNDYIAHIVQQTRAQILPIEQAEALRVRHPALEPALIPKGIYQGYPPIPPVDLPTISVRRLLISNRHLDTGVVRQLTQIVSEHQREIADAISEESADLRPLVTEIKRPNPSEGTGIALHDGAIAYYERDRPTFMSTVVSFLTRNGGLLIALTTLPAGSLVGLWEWWQQLKQKADERKLLADQYIDAAIRSMELSIELDLGDRQ